MHKSATDIIEKVLSFEFKLSRLCLDVRDEHPWSSNSLTGVQLS